MTERTADVGAIDRVDLRRTAMLTALALGMRLVYLLRLDLPPFDPWRHLALVRNLRAGVGFTLFDGQPYLWYSPIWYRVCAAFPPWVGMEWIAGLCSVLSVPALYFVGRHLAGRTAATIAAGLLAACGPAVAFTCHYGPEALALGLTLASVALVASHPGAISTVSMTSVSPDSLSAWRSSCARTSRSTCFSRRRGCAPRAARPCS